MDSRCCWNVWFGSLKLRKPIRFLAQLASPEIKSLIIIMLGFRFSGLKDCRRCLCVYINSMRLSQYGKLRLVICKNFSFGKSSENSCQIRFNWLNEAQDKCSFSCETINSIETMEMCSKPIMRNHLIIWAICTWNVAVYWWKYGVVSHDYVKWVVSNRYHLAGLGKNV